MTERLKISLPYILIILTAIVIYANKAMGRILKAAPSKIVGARFMKYIDKSSLKEAGECFRKVKGGTPTVCDELKILDKKDRFPFC